MHDFLRLNPFSWAADMPDQPSAVPAGRDEPSVEPSASPAPPAWLVATTPRIFRLANRTFEPPTFDLCLDLARLLGQSELDDVPVPSVVGPDERRRPGCRWEVGRHAVVVVMGPRGASVEAYTGPLRALSIFYATNIATGLPHDGEEKSPVVRLRLALLWLFGEKAAGCDAGEMERAMEVRP